MKRRTFLHQSLLAGTGVLLSRKGWSAPQPDPFPQVRIAEGARKFKSKAVERVINEVKAGIGNKELGWLFENCFPNTLDTTVDFEVNNGVPDTFVITGDIDAMWLRDSTAQVWPYLPLCKEDRELHRLIEGVIHRQAKCILLDPYANAFYKDTNKISIWKNDQTDMKPGVHERKWEIDSLCYPIRLSYGLWKQTGDISVFDADWIAAMKLVVQTFMEQQRISGRGSYHFQRSDDSQSMGGYGFPAKPNGLICSMFRPSDDATVFPYLIPSNLFAATSLRQLSEIFDKLGTEPSMISPVRELSRTIWQAVQTYGTVMHPRYGKIYAYEVNGYGGVNVMDDANIPSLMSLPYLGAFPSNDPVYLNTRRMILSEESPFYFAGAAAEGVGSPHTGLDMIWHLGIIMRGLTSMDDTEVRKCLEQLRLTHAGTGFMHESFDKNAPLRFTRKWFAWANSLFGEFIWKLYRERKDLLG